MLSPGPQESSKISYGALRHAIGEQASALSAAGARPGRIVAVGLPRSPEAIITILAVLQTGAAYLPLDPSAPPARNQAILADARPVAIVNEHIVALDDPREIQPAAYVIYTSGSTGTPNGVVVGHEALNHFVAAATARYGITKDDRVLQFAPLHFDASIEEIFLTLCAGATLVLRPDEISVPALLEACEANQVSVLDLPTAYWHELAYVLASGAAVLPSSIRTVIIGGEAALPDRVARWREAVPDHVKLLNTYGPTETTVVAVVAELSQVDGEVPIGRPLPGVRAAVRDGELWLFGPTLAQGYLGQPELTARRFADHEGSRAYRTGDLVRLNAGGELVFAGRADHELKISGHRIDPAAVESVLLTHPDVIEVAVVGQPLATGAKRLTAFVVLGKESDLRSHAAGTLPAAAVPTAFVRLERLPRTSTGKIDRNALRDFSPPSALAPQELTQTEALVLQVWAEVLGATDLAATDDFFARGGQSLQTIQVASRLSVALGRSIPATLVFANPTAAMLAAALDGSSVTVTDFRADAVLPPDLVPAPARTAPVPPTVILTGATGFVGAHLLAELPGRIICPVRGDASRLVKALDRWQVKVPGLAERVRVVSLDLAQSFTFDEHVDAIYHSAATVSVVRGYSSMRPVNVDATLALLRLAATRGAAFHHISTLAVANGSLVDGYQQSKWVAEELVHQAFSRGLVGGIYRLGRVAGSTSTAIVNPDDLVWRILRAGLPRGVLPALDIAEVWTPVDIVAQAIASHSLSQSVHNLGSTLRLGDVWKWCRDYGYSFRTVPPGQWASAIRSSGPVGDDVEATLAFFDGPPVEVAEFPSGQSLPTVDQDLMFRYLDNAQIPKEK
ncbi:MAG TPA: hypothetical protein DGG94_08185 [Micromonosporaceae bacterium]|nr:hypothetical protein [Micromonosporaceae bacterium]